MSKTKEQRIDDANYVSFFMRGIDKIEDKDLKISVLSSKVVDLERQVRRLKHEVKSKLQKKGLKLSDFEIQESKMPFSIQGEKFYNSIAWRNLRFRFLKNADTSKCGHCLKDLLNKSNELHVDHIKPRLLYPELALDIKNLQVLCKDCNLGKGATKHKATKIKRIP